ncbi:MAG TPA: nuclear transport factor 2 family protein [Myxococcota bacterium]|nr:nuclear transport factor 2 family protein [Myxococcota bacterium]
MKAIVWLSSLGLAVSPLASAAAARSAAAESAARASAARSELAARPATDAPRAAVERLVADYIDLYAEPTLDRWAALFHPSLQVVFPEPDGAVGVRNLAEFLERQRAYFATGRRISERLDKVRIELGRRIARVSADFIFVDEAEEKPGRLGLHLVEEAGDWRIVAVLFSYDAEAPTAPAR